MNKGIAPSTPRVSRLIDTNVELLGESSPEERAYLHTILTQCSLPYRRPPEGTRDYIRENGRASLILTAGYLIDPVTKKATMVGLPYGVKPRLLMLHLCTKAVRTKSPHISIADSMSAFMKELGLGVRGGARGTIAPFKEQLNRLAASRMQLMMDFGDHCSVMNPAPLIRKFDVWFPSDPRQRMLWPTEVTLASEFFETLVDHALPLDPRSIAALQHSARGLDCYTWLAHRLPRVRRRSGDRVSWAALRGQFGGESSVPKSFRNRMTEALKQALGVYPAAKVELVEGGVLLRRSPPPIATKRSYPQIGR